VAVVIGAFLTATTAYYLLAVYFITHRIKMNESGKAICCHGSGTFNEDPHTQLAVTMDISRSVATSHVPCLMC
jgi:hypothetical protein